VKHAEHKSVESSVDLNVAHSLKRAEHQTAECVVSNPETREFDRSVSGSGQGKGAGTEGKCVDNTLFASSSTRTSLKSESAIVHSDLVMRGYSSGVYENVSPMGFKSSTIQRWLSSNRTSQKIKASSVSNQWGMFLAKHGLFAPRTSVHSAYRKNYRGGRKLEWLPVRTSPKASCTIVSHRAESLNGSDGDHGLEPGESIIADGGSGAAQQKKGSDLVQKRATLELSLLHLHDNLSYVENEVTCDGAKPSCTENIVKKFTNLNVDLDPSVQKYSENAAVRPHTSDSTHVSSDLYVRSSRKFEASDSFNQPEENVLGQSKNICITNNSTVQAEKLGGKYH
jgi:hypothetical protein